MVDRVMELSSHRQSIVTPSPECSIPSTKSARHASPLYCRRACAPSSLYYVVTRRSRTHLCPLPLLADAEAISSEQSPEVVPSRWRLPALAPFLLHSPRHAIQRWCHLIQEGEGQIAARGVQAFQRRKKRSLTELGSFSFNERVCRGRLRCSEDLKNTIEHPKACDSCFDFWIVSFIRSLVGQHFQF
ncbi:hypothetical protein PVAP13_3KG537501 [Panicum virgatum]|uniref:Uncharacterized protein n=1 Tax=Panicum virgatum TaxID=38727 RepID=A0A8T0V1P2_PANVG|nr:hypothetical protein PVAP13_3KG537501 [Panicum virgatum]